MSGHVAVCKDSFFTMMVESGTVYRDETISFKLKNGKEIKS
ncbi:hypothetical protein Aocu_01700 [Acholeplasma oculi]|uniref:Uncharacterized protein n=1 Tax=Acholeplasma oculi TaxID=35623 RepID=A0A061A8T1_9MOLU|nr:hypothetical protein Aocu_01700 [Acholeplasma oculi]